MDFSSRPAVVVAPDDLEEHLSSLLLACVQHTAQHVRTTAAFMPSSAPTSGRMGRLAGHIREKEFLAVYAQLSGLVQDDALFLEFLHHTCNPLPRVRSKREQLKRV